MRFEILKENIQKSLSIVEKATGKNLTLPILESVLMETEENFLKLTCTDLETAIISKSLIKNINKGKTVAPVKIFSDFISLLPDKEITVSLKSKKLLIESLSFQTEIPTQNPEDFPVTPKIQTETFVKTKNPELTEGLSQVAGLAAITPTKPELSGVYFSFKGNILTLAATDSFRLAEKTIKLEKDGEEFNFILPLKTVRELINILKDKEGLIEIYPSPNLVLFRFSSKDISFFVEVISKTIEGEYPDYKEIIPQKYKTTIISKKDKLLNYIKAASLFSGKTNEIKLKIRPKENDVIISAQSSESGQTQSSLGVKIEGKPLEVCFNHKFLIDGLLNIKSSEASFELTDEENPGALKPVGDLSYIYILMPIKNY